MRVDTLYRSSKYINTGVDEKIILKWNFKKWGGGEWSGLIWLRIETVGWRLLMR
jgi:hypothetical protein